MKVEKTPIMLDKERHLVYDLSAFYDLEKKYGSTSKALKTISDDVPGSLAYLLHIGLKRDELVPEDHIELWIDLSNKLIIKSNVIQAISSALPLPEQNRHTSNHQKTDHDDRLDWDWLYYIGTVLLEMSEAVFWRTTPRKLLALWAVHKKYNGLDQEEGQTTSDATQAWIDQYI